MTYDPSKDHDELFDTTGLDDKPVQGAGEGARQAPQKTVGSAWCPEHSDERKTGVIRQGTHVVWRVHDKRTIGGSIMPCRASGVSLCEATPLSRSKTATTAPQVQEAPPRCTHPPAP